MKDKSLFLYLSIAITLLLIVVRDLGDLAIPGILIAVWVSVSALCLNKENTYSFAYAVLPLAVGIPGYTYLLLSSIIFFKQENTNRRQLFPFSVLALLEIFHAFGYTFSFEIAGVISFLSFLFLFFLLIFSEDNNINRKQSLLFYCIGTTFALIIVYARIIIDSGFATLIAGELREGAAMGNYEDKQLDNHLMMNANCIAYYSITLLSIAVVYYSKHYFNRVFLSFFFFVAIATGMLSFSRTWMLVAGIIMLWFVLSNNKNKNTIIAMMVLVMVLLVVGIYSGLMDEVLEVFAFRLENDNVESAGGRLPLFKAYNDFVTSNIYYTIFGTGATYYKQVCHLWNSIHNGTQQIFVSFGIIGLITYLFAARIFVKKYINYSVKNNLILFIPFLSSLIFVQSIQFLNPYPLMLPFIAAACVLRIEE